MVEEQIKKQIELVKKDKNKIISLSSDVIFKAVFKRCEDVLIKMIKDIFELEEDIYNPITVVGYETLSINKNGKVYRADMVVRLSDKSKILVEMNNCNDEEVIDRNLVQLVRIHSEMLPKGLDDIELSQYRLKGINFNNFPNVTGEPIEYFAFCNIKTGKIVSVMYSFCNVDLEKCFNLVYDIGVSKLPKAVRWGAILKESNIKKISDILGEDMLDMKEKEEFLDVIETVNDDDAILHDWLLDELEKHKERCQRDYAMKQGRLEGIKQGREEGIKQGREEGREEGIIIKEKELIHKLIKRGDSLESISELTDKTIDEIIKISNDI